MDSKIAADERINFSDRFKSTLTSLGISARPAVLAREFNARADGATVTPHAVRKWLVGEAIPTHERIAILACWLGVHAAWLRYGDAENGPIDSQMAPVTRLSADQWRLARDVAGLPPPAQQIVRDLLDSLKRSLPALAAPRVPGTRRN